MTREELNQQLKELEKKYYQDRKKLFNEYALANNPYKVGDIITDHIKTIKIEEISVDNYCDHVECTYIGPRIKKDGTPFKDAKREMIYQSNIVTK